MTLYYYSARNGEGVFVRGSLQASSAPEALNVLNNRGLFVSILDQGSSMTGVFSTVLQSGPVSQRAIVTFFRSLATLTKAGVALSRSLAICAEQTGNSRLREALNGVAAELQNGRSLSEAMFMRPREFSAFAAASVRAGEQSGALDEILMRLAAGLERDRSMRRKLVTALSYPAIVLGAAAGVCVLLLTTTVPVFQAMYEQMRVQVPPFLRMLVATVMFLRSYAFVAITACALVAMVLTMCLMRPSPRISAFLEGCRLRLPIIGPIAKKAGSARIARLLGTLLGCGVSLHAAIPIVLEATQRGPFRESLEALRRALFEGSSIAPAFAATNLYDSYFIQLVRVGEESGTVGEVLLRIADSYDLDVEASLHQLGSALEPIMILVLGGVVGTIAAGVFIPLYSLIGSMK